MTRMPKKGLDSNIIVYSLLEDHPASEVCGGYLKDSRHTFYTTSLTPFEVYFALHRIYGIPPAEASSKVLSLLQAPLTIFDVRASDLHAAIRRCATKGIETNDSLLVQMCVSSEIPSLVSDDRRLLRVCEEEGIHPECPIGEDHRRLMQEWEKAKLVPAGLPRLLSRVHSWMQEINPQLAESFLQASENLRHLP